MLDGKIIAASAEERFNREKHSREFPFDAIDFCLKKAGITDINEVDEISVGFDYWKLFLYLHFFGFFRYFPKHIQTSFVKGAYTIKTILNTKRILRRELGYRGSVRFLDHHDCHASAVFYPSGFKDAAILTIDGRGEMACMRIYRATGGNFEKLFQLNYPNSLGVFYASITEYLGFKRHEGEGKVMGLAPYGKNNLVNKMRKVLSVSNDSYKLNLKYFEMQNNSSKNVSQEFIRLFGLPRAEGEKIEQRHKDIARATQTVLEEAVIALTKRTRQMTGRTNLCLTGGIALNSVANGKMLEKRIFENVYIYPAAGDDGVSVGAALYSSHSKRDNLAPARINQTPYLGYSSDDLEILNVIKGHGLNFRKSKNISKEVAILLTKGKCVGWFQSRAEIGPRALGNRSIVVDPREADNKNLVNSKIKFRESFRPFAPSVLEEYSEEYFDTKGIRSPYMILTFNVRKEKRKVIPAVTHIDGTARVQTVSKRQNKKYWDLINEFYKLTGVPVILNTSFNKAGEPIVNKPEEAISCFLTSGLDALAVGDYLIIK